MHPLKKIFGLGLATVMDAGSGIIITYIIWTLLGLDIVWWHYALGMLFSIMPDFDELVPLARELLGGPQNDTSHKALPTHHPLKAIPTISIVLLLLPVPNQYILLAAICLLVIIFMIRGKASRMDQVLDGWLRLGKTTISSSLNIL